MPVGLNPFAVAVNSSTNKIYVSNSGEQSVTVIDGATNSTTTVGVGRQPFGLAVNTATNQVYVANYASQSVTVIDGATNNTTSVATDLGPYFVAVNPVTNKAYVTNTQLSNTVTVIDGTTNQTPHAVASLEQSLHEMATNEPGSACNEYLSHRPTRLTGLPAALSSLARSAKNGIAIKIVEEASDLWPGQRMKSGQNYVVQHIRPKEPRSPPLAVAAHGLRHRHRHRLRRLPRRRCHRF